MQRTSPNYGIPGRGWRKPPAEKRGLQLEPQQTHGRVCGCVCVQERGVAHFWGSVRKGRGQTHVTCP